MYLFCTSLFRYFYLSLSRPLSLLCPCRKEARRTCGVTCLRTHSSPGCPTKYISSIGTLTSKQRLPWRVERKLRIDLTAEALTRGGFSSPVQVLEIYISRSYNVIPQISVCLQTSLRVNKGEGSLRRTHITHCLLDIFNTNGLVLPQFRNSSHYYTAVKRVLSWIRPTISMIIDKRRDK